MKGVFILFSGRKKYAKTPPTSSIHPKGTLSPLAAARAQVPYLSPPCYASRLNHFTASPLPRANALRFTLGVSLPHPKPPLCKGRLPRIFRRGMPRALPFERGCTAKRPEGLSISAHQRSFFDTTPGFAPLNIPLLKERAFLAFPLRGRC